MKISMNCQCTNFVTFWTYNINFCNSISVTCWSKCFVSTSMKHIIPPLMPSWNFYVLWFIIIWWNIWSFDSFSDSEILMPLNHYTYLKNLMTMILYILYEILAFNKSLHIFEKFDDLILFYHLKYIFSVNHYILLKL